MSELAGPSHVTAVTGMECCEFTYEWTIKNFSQSYKKIIESPSFSSHYGDFDDKWILRIYIDSVSNKRGGISIHILANLQLQSFNNTSQLQTKCKILINDKYEITKEHDFSEFPETMNCNKLIPRSGFSDAISVFYVRQQLSVDLKKLLLNEKLSDVILRVGQKSFHAIKGILAVRSPVFAAI
ncbi:uncharacterized protein LOC122853965 [Aphidius gifuensis]|uniref:uncharacterized protein LOC122853965 n=1 Tax=Aphidius gifuensis TaxID=684658 RepID=UPI001CDB58C2|nr:uncharacterized protein LOC122853965 [Aphidius gifuensis]